MFFVYELFSNLKFNIFVGSDFYIMFFKNMLFILKIDDFVLEKGIFGGYCISDFYNYYIGIDILWKGISKKC